jgi:hypothetical protein
MQRPHLYLMERKSNTARWRGDVARGEAAPGGEKEETVPVALTRILLDRKIKKSTQLIHLL